MLVLISICRHCLDNHPSVLSILTDAKTYGNFTALILLFLYLIVVKTM